MLLAGVRDEDIAAAKSLFLTFSQENPVEVTQYGEVLDNGAGLGRVYISGVYANDEPNFERALQWLPRVRRTMWRPDPEPDPTFG